MQESDFPRLVGQVAELMSTMEGTWDSRPATGWTAAAHLVRDDGLQLVLILNGRSVTARGVWPHGPRPPYGPPAPEITMAATSAQYVSGHIKRRLLARLEEVFAQWIQGAAAAEAERSARGASSARIAAALARIPGRRIWTEAQDAHRSTLVRRLGPRVNVRAKVGPAGEEVELAVSGLTGSAAAELCAFLAQLTRRPAISDTPATGDGNALPPARTPHKIG
ncbi:MULTISPECIES: hypothetical protein [unclassified Streptomyces]|uniref:hypothetical protein n=1 Tax=unclassified Streptomyces TaxID=2593676 RepID=UPI0035DD5597